MIKTYSYPYLTVLAEENLEAIQGFLRRVELLAGSMALLTAPKRSGSNTQQSNSRSESLPQNYWVLSDTLSVRFPWIESSLNRTIDGLWDQVALIHNMSTLWHLSSGRHALDSHFEIMELRRRLFENLGQTNLALESSDDDVSPRVVSMQRYGLLDRPADIWNASNHLPPQPYPPQMLIDAARSTFAEKKKEECREWRRPLHCIRRHLIAAAVEDPLYYDHLIDYAIGLTEEKCDDSELLLVPEAVESLTY